MIKRYFETFGKLHSAVVKGLVAPHKAILLLSILELREFGSFKLDRIYLSDDLIDAFSYMWKRYMGQVALFKCDVAQPFWYMKSEPFWTLYRTDGSIAQNDQRIPSLETLQDEYYAVLSPDLFVSLQDSNARAFMRTALIAQYIAPICFTLEKDVTKVDDKQVKKSDSVVHNKRAKAKVLRILKKDGSVIYRDTAVDTFAQAISEVGVNSAQKVLPQLFSYDPEERRVPVAPGYYIKTCNSTKSKKEYLDKLSSTLGLGWIVEMV